MVLPPNILALRLLYALRLWMLHKKKASYGLELPLEMVFY